MSSVSIVNGLKHKDVGNATSKGISFVKTNTAKENRIESIVSFPSIATEVSKPLSLNTINDAITTIVLNDNVSKIEYSSFPVSTLITTDDQDNNIITNSGNMTCSNPSFVYGNIINNKMDMSCKIDMKGINTHIEDKSCKLTINCEHISTIVSYVDLDIGTLNQRFGALSTDVIDDRDYSDDNHIPGGSGGTDATGGDLVEVNITAQLMSFVEFKLKFHDKKVLDVSGLPEGLRYDSFNEKITGSPTKSGNYSIYVIFEDEKALKGKIHVPSLFRTI